MNKIGILTYYYKSKNIGGLLQSYALTSILNKYNFQAEQICFDYDYRDLQAIRVKTTLRYEKLNPKDIIKRLFFYKRKIKSFFSKKPPVSLMSVQNEKFDSFKESIPHSAYSYNNSNIIDSNKVYQTFLLGSDQIWNTELLPLSAYYGEFTTPDRRVVSYGASSNVKQFSPASERLFIKKLQRVDAISVREKTLKEYIERITCKKVQLVLDPTFLLSPQEWLKIANQKVVPQKPYIFCYFLGDKCAWQRQVVQSYADKYGYEIVHLPYIMRTIRSADKYLKGQERYDVGPREFIALIANAKYIFTDSFHGLAFSINFGKNFYVFNRNDEIGPNSMNARITDTLNLFNLSDRRIMDNNTILNNTQIDFTNAHKILEQEKQKSINWLLNVLKE